MLPGTRIYTPLPGFALKKSDSLVFDSSTCPDLTKEALWSAPPPTLHVSLLPFVPSERILHCRSMFFVLWLEPGDRSPTAHISRFVVPFCKPNQLPAVFCDPISHPPILPRPFGSSAHAHSLPTHPPTDPRRPPTIYYPTHPPTNPPSNQATPSISSPFLLPTLVAENNSICWSICPRETLCSPLELLAIAQASNSLSGRNPVHSNLLCIFPLILFLQLHQVAPSFSFFS
jgi:hypothetical protein